MKTIYKNLIFSCLAIFIVSCASTSNNQNNTKESELLKKKTAPTIDSKAILSLKNNNNKNSNQQDLEKEDTKYTNVQEELLKAQRQINKEQYKEAITTLNKLLAQDLNQSEKTNVYLLSAYIAISLENEDVAFEFLEKVSLGSLSQNAKLSYYQMLFAVFYMQGDYIEAAKALDDSFIFQNKNNRLKTTAQIWQTLNRASTSDIKNYAKSRTNSFSAWLDLNLAVAQLAQNQRNFEIWQLNNQNHKANLILDEIYKREQNKNQTARSINVLLPLSGRFKNQGQAVQEGITYFFLNQENSIENINFIDTNPDIDLAFEKAKENNPDLIIGPLLKQNINKVAKKRVDFPILFLNLNDSPKVENNLFYLALNPEDEAVSAAKKMYQNGKRKPLLFVPKTSIGERLSSSFITKWQELSNTKPIISYYEPRKNLATKVKQAIDVDKSYKRIAHIERTLKKDVKFEMRSRQDFDSIYIVASNADIKLIKPFFDANLSPFAPRVAFYTSSSANNIKASRTNELRGLNFSDIPLVFAKTPNQKKIKSDYLSLNPNTSSLDLRLFSLGFDSLNLRDNLYKLRRDDKEINLLSGKINIDEQGIAIRQLNWGQFHSRGYKAH